MDLHKYKYPIIFFTFFLTILFGFQIKNITVFHDIDKFVPKNRDDLKFLKEFNLALEPDDSYYLVALENSGKSIFDSTFLSKTHALTHELKGLENITKAVSITSVNTPLKTPFTGMVMTSLLAFDQPSKYHSDSIRIANDERVYGLLVSKDFKSLLIYLKTKNNLTQLPSKQLDQDIKTIVQKYRFSETHYAGKSNVQSEFEKLIQKEIKFNIILSLSVLLVILVLVFRKFWAVVVALLSVVIGAVIFIGFLGYLGKPLNLMSMLFPPLMFIVGISDVVHFFTNFSKNISEGLPTRLAMKKTINEIGWATLLTSLTTSVGFASLIFSQIEPIKDFGWTAAIGVFIAYLVVIFFTSSIMLVIPTKWLIVDHKDGEDFWNKLMKNIFFLVINNKKKITIITSIVVAISIVGTLNISTNAYLLSDVPTNSSLMKDVSFFEKNYSGIRNYEVAVVPTGNNKINDFKVLKEIDKLEKHLATYKIAGISSPATIYKSLNKASKGNKKEAFTIPDNPNFIKQYRKMASQYENRNINKVVNADMNMGRITGLMIDIGSDNVRKQNEAIKGWISKNINPEIVTFKPTGKALLIDNNNKYLRTSIFESVGIALLLVSVLMGLIYKDINMVFISLVPNLIPLLFAAAIIGLIGVELKAATSIIFAIAFGIAVDDTIHFLTKYKIEREKGLSVIRSVYNTYIDTGKAIILTTAILFFGFIMLSFSSFKPIFYIGFLLSVTFLASLISCLFVMPHFILWIMRHKEKYDNSQVKKIFDNKD